MTTIERCPHPHAWPAIECTGVRLKRSRRAPVCMCGHPKTVHEHWRPGFDCGKCDCRHYETAHGAVRYVVWVGCGLICVVFWGAVILGIGWPLARAIVRHW
jgi:hypothetical protein